jgi:ParB family chromosome partitioning protein
LGTPEGSGGGEGVWRLVPLGEIRPGPYQGRQAFSEESLQQLAETVRQHGVLQPVVLRPVSGGYELVAGERRWRAARLAGLTAIPAVVRDLSDREAAVLSLVENGQREELGYLEEAEAYRKVLEEFRISQEELAGLLGRSQPAVANKLRLLRLEPAVRERLSRAGLTERHARALLRLDSEGARLRAAEAFAARQMTAREAEAWVARSAAGEGARGPRGREADPAGVRAALAQLKRALVAAGYRVRVARSRTPEGWEYRVRAAKVGGEAGERGRG